jgi:hypothetical protein
VPTVHPRIVGHGWRFTSGVLDLDPVDKGGTVRGGSSLPSNKAINKEGAMAGGGSSFIDP